MSTITSLRISNKGWKGQNRKISYTFFSVASIVHEIALVEYRKYSFTFKFLLTSFTYFIFSDDDDSPLNPMNNEDFIVAVDRMVKNNMVFPNDILPGSM